MEPINGCAIAAVNQREVLRAKAYLHPAIPARLLQLRYPRGPLGHMALIYRIDEGWCAYDDKYGSRRLSLPRTTTYPRPIDAARAAFPCVAISDAFWYGVPALPGRARVGER